MSPLDRMLDRDRLRSVASILAFRLKEYSPDDLLIFWERFRAKTSPAAILELLDEFDRLADGASVGSDGSDVPRS